VKSSRLSEEQISSILREHEARSAAAENCRKYGRSSRRSRTQRNEIYQDLTNQPKESAPGFSPRVGEQVPSDLQLKPLPHSVTRQVREVGSYQYAMLGRQVLIVDPDSKKIVDIVTE
jgi:hypothetical protein